jgi:hypothetical protein
MNSVQLALSSEKVCSLTWKTSDTFSKSTSITKGGCLVSEFGTAVAKAELKRKASSDFFYYFLHSDKKSEPPLELHDSSSHHH